MVVTTAESLPSEDSSRPDCLLQTRADCRPGVTHTPKADPNTLSVEVQDGIGLADRMG